MAWSPTFTAHLLCGGPGVYFILFLTDFIWSLQEACEDIAGAVLDKHRKAERV